MERTLTISEHANTRAKERLGLSKKSMQRMAVKVYNKGMDEHKLIGAVRAWAETIQQNEREPSDLRIYGEHLYVFRRNNLVTVFRIPKRYKQQAIRQQKGKQKCRKLHYTQNNESESAWEQTNEVLNG